MEQKRCVDMHMHMATYLAKEIKNRQLDLLNDVEEKLITLQSLQVLSLSHISPSFHNVFYLHWGEVNGIH